MSICAQGSVRVGISLRVFTLVRTCVCLCLYAQMCRVCLCVCMCTLLDVRIHVCEREVVCAYISFVCACVYV